MYTTVHNCNLFHYAYPKCFLVLKVILYGFKSVFTFNKSMQSKRKTLT